MFGLFSYTRRNSKSVVRKGVTLQILDSNARGQSLGGFMFHAGGNGRAWASDERIYPNESAAEIAGKKFIDAHLGDKFFGRG